MRREEKAASTGRKFCKGLKEESKAAALTVELSHGQEKSRVTNCSREETLASQMDTVRCKRHLLCIF